MTNKLQFSIVIPSYNRASHLRPAIESLLAQDYQHFEVLVVDDGSTDNTSDVVKSFTDPRIKYLYQTNSERGVARNKGIAEAKGDIIGFLDSDDVVLPTHLSTAAAFIHENNDSSVFCFSFRSRTNGIDHDTILPKDINDALFDGNVLSCNGVMIKSELLKKNLFSTDRALSALEDWELWLRISTQTTFASCNSVTSIIIQHEDRSVLQTVPQKIENRFAAFYKHIETLKQSAGISSRNIRRLYSSCETYMALHIALTGKDKNIALLHLRRGIKHSLRVIFTRRFLAIIKHLIL